MKQNNVFENHELKMEIKDNILFANYKAGLRFTIEDAKRFVEQRLEFLNGKKYPIIVIDEGVISMDKGARGYFVSSEGVRGLTSAVFIESSFFSKMLIDFILRIANPKIPVMAFTDLNEAVEWVNTSGR